MSNLAILTHTLEQRRDIEVVHIEQDNRIPARHSGLDQWCEIFLAPTDQYLYYPDGDRRYGSALEILLRSLVTADLELSVADMQYAIALVSYGNSERGLVIGSFAIDDIIGTRDSIYTITDDAFGYPMDPKTGTYTLRASSDLKRRTIVRLYPTSAIAKTVAETQQNKHEIPMDLLKEVYAAA